MTKHSTQVITITGATGKIGFETALAFAKPKTKLVLTYHKNKKRAHELAKLAESKGAETQTLKTNITTPNGIKKTCIIKPDILIHCAGTFPKSKWPNVSKKEWNEAITENLESTFFLVQECSKKMKQGKIIILTDTCTNHFYKNHIPYCISKSGIDMLIKGLSHILLPNITINGIAPYLAGKTPKMSKKLWDKLKESSIDPKLVAKKIVSVSKLPLSKTGMIFKVM